VDSFVPLEAEFLPIKTADQETAAVFNFFLRDFFFPKKIEIYKKRHFQLRFLPGVIKIYVFLG